MDTDASFIAFVIGIATLVVATITLIVAWYWGSRSAKASEFAIRPQLAKAIIVAFAPDNRPEVTVHPGAEPTIAVLNSSDRPVKRLRIGIRATPQGFLVASNRWKRVPHPIHGREPGVDVWEIKRSLTIRAGKEKRVDGLRISPEAEHRDNNVHSYVKVREHVIAHGQNLKFRMGVRG